MNHGESWIWKSENPYMSHCLWFWAIITQNGSNEPSVQSWRGCSFIHTEVLKVKGLLAMYILLKRVEGVHWMTATCHFSLWLLSVVAPPALGRDKHDTLVQVLLVSILILGLAPNWRYHACNSPPMSMMMAGESKELRAVPPSVRKFKIVKVNRPLVYLDLGSGRIKK